MQYLGRKKLGEELAFPIVTTNAAGTPSFPTEAPILDVWSGTTLLLSGLKMPKIDGAATGVFKLGIFLDGRFAAGHHEGVARWTISTYIGVEVLKFEITAGGDAKGAIIAMHHLEIPQERFIVAQTDAGRLFKLKRPSI